MGDGASANTDEKRRARSLLGVEPPQTEPLPVAPDLTDEMIKRARAAALPAGKYGLDATFISGPLGTSSRKSNVAGIFG